MNYHGPARTYPYVSFADAALKKFPPGTFKDKIVLVGASATGIGDLRATPFGGLDFPGVEIHANLIDNILNQQFLVSRGAAGSDRHWIYSAFRHPAGNVAGRGAAALDGAGSCCCWCPSPDRLLGVSARLVAEFHRSSAFHAGAQRQPGCALSRAHRRAGKTQNSRRVPAIRQPGSHSALAERSRTSEAAQDGSDRAVQ